MGLKSAWSVLPSERMIVVSLLALFW